MDEEIEKRNEDNILHTGLRACLNEINLLEYSGKFLENGYDDLDQLSRKEGLSETKPQLTCIFT